MNKNLRNTLLLLLLAIVWGLGFSIQSIGGKNLGPFTFFAFRNYFSIITMTLFFIFIRKDDDLSDNSYSIKMGLICGIIEFFAAVFQQVSVMHTAAANTSFITALYVVLVPVIGVVFGNKTSKKTWFCIVLVMIGLYLLCINDGFIINKGDLFALGASVMFALHIISIDKGGQKLDSILFCFVQYLECGVLATICMFVFESPINIQTVGNTVLPLMYTGIISSAIAVTIQVNVQKDVDPTIASLVMSLESVFGALFGWLILRQILSPKELLGCLVMFVAIVISQIGDTKKQKQ